MSSLLSDPRVTVHIGDGFKFLADNVATYDAIITDSSDPVGPAASLFQKPYFELLRDALAPGGHIATQGECLWIHLPLISEVLATVRALFPVTQYAFTTIPTYPAGQIGFALASKEAGRDMSVPLRTIEGTRYYSAEVHKAAFVLPEFARKYLMEGKDVRPKFGPSAVEGAPTKKVLLLGSGAVARPCAEYVARNPQNALTIGTYMHPKCILTQVTPSGMRVTACRTLKSAEAIANDLPNTTARSLDAGSDDPEKRAALEQAVAEHDLVISLVPYIFHTNVIRAAIKGKTNVVTTSYISPAIRALEDEVKAAGIVVMNEIGLDPGVDHLYAVKTIDEVHAKGGKVSCLQCFSSSSRPCPCPCLTSTSTCLASRYTRTRRSKNSTRSAAGSPRPNAPTTRSATSSPGPRAVGSSRCSTTRPTSPRGSRSTCPGRSS